MPITFFKRRAAVSLLVVAVCVCMYRLGAVPLLDDPNEAEYAEAAREMVGTGDWISPHLNDGLFLNKPPLTYWLIGLADLAFGINEFTARLPSALSGLLIVFLLVRLGTVVFDSETGLLAGFVLLATGGFFFETHAARPDLVLTAAIVGSLLAFAHLLRLPADGAHAGKARERWALLGLQVSLALGLLAKGLLAVVLSGFVFLLIIITERRFDLLPRLLHPRAWWLLLLLAGPWHLLVGLRHPGFLWDYVVNRHVLFFFDRKLPYDSTPVSLLTFWAALALRLFPWTLFVPLALLAAGRRAWRERAFGDRLALVWTGAVLLLFSAAPSRMEHYSIPALPAIALLVAKLFRDYARDESVRWSQAVTAHLIVWTALALVAPFAVPSIVQAQEWLVPLHDLPALARTTFMLFAAGTVIAMVLAWVGRRAWVAPAIVGTFVAGIPFFHHGLIAVARVNSSAGMAAALRALAEPEERVVYEAPIEYQSCAGFNFYLRRKLDVLRPPGFVAPAYLEPHVGELFIDGNRLQQLWPDERIFFITDPLTPRARLDGIVPQPFYIVARDYARWAVTNHPLH
jgi:4-amino-4-deoxy-L-arabinose transferase-like glycosyltransferase